MKPYEKKPRPTSKPCGRPTKTDIEALRQATKTDIALIQRDIEVLRKETKADIANLKADLLKWMFGALIAQGGIIVTLIVALI